MTKRYNNKKYKIKKNTKKKIKGGDMLAQGAFGCVHKPPLHCNKKMNMADGPYISKLMKTKSAEKELRDFVLISKIDTKDEYHLGTPAICEPATTEENLEEINQCKRFTSREVRNHPNSFRLLILKDGGYDLSIFCKDYLIKYVSADPHNAHLFWIEVHHLIKGLQFLSSRNIVHHDLKPQNIVFNMRTRKLMFIDFGLMNTKTDILEEANKSELSSGNFHWSYPFDNGFLNRNYFNYFIQLTKEEKQEFKEKFKQYLFTDDHDMGSIRLYIKKPGSFHLLFTYIHDIDDDRINAEDVDMFFDSFSHFLSRHSYSEFAHKTVNSIDIYGLGFTLQYVLNTFFNLQSISSTFYTKTTQLFQQMYSFRYDLRLDNCDTVLKAYERILSETDTSLSLIKMKNKNKKDKQSTISSKLEKIAYEDPPVIIDSSSSKQIHTRKKRRNHHICRTEGGKKRKIMRKNVKM